MKIFERILTYIVAGSVFLTAVPVYSYAAADSGEILCEEESAVSEGAQISDPGNAQADDPETVQTDTEYVRSADPESATVVEYETEESEPDSDLNIPDNDFLLEGYIESQILDETGTESSLAGYDDVIGEDMTCGDLSDDMDPVSEDGDEETWSDSVEALYADRYYNLYDYNYVWPRVYNTIKTSVKKIASGEENYCVVKIYYRDLGLDKTRFTAEELGVERIASRNYTCKNCGKVIQDKKTPDRCPQCDSTGFTKGNLVFDRNAKAAVTKMMRTRVGLIVPSSTSVDYSLYTAEERADMTEQYKKNRYKILYSLLSDIPYDLYWFDKVAGWTPGVTWSYSGNEDYIDISDSYITFWMPPSKEYKYDNDDAESKYLCDTTLTYAASQVVPRAKAIVREASGECYYDYEKLAFYKNKIYELAPVYNHSAISNNAPYGNPWQLIWVFDYDPDTNVVCEGYSKAFKLLCDLSDFHYEGFDCYLMSGFYNGTEARNGHMWNSVRMDDGKNYLIDITNSLATDKLFMKGYTSWDGTWYVYSGSRYRYKDQSIEVFSEEERTMSDTDYAGMPYIRRYHPEEKVRYTGEIVDPGIAVFNSKSGEMLDPEKDYTLEYTGDRLNVGGRFTVCATTTKTGLKSNVLKIDIYKGTNYRVEIPEENYIYKGKPIEPEVTVVNNVTGEILEAGKDVTVTYLNNNSIGTATVAAHGMGNYTGTAYADFNISVGTDDYLVTVKGGDGSGENRIYYDGTAKIPDLTIVNATTNEPLIPGTDYTIKYTNNINAGIATATVTGRGSYQSSNTISFVISPLSINSEEIYTEPLISAALKKGKKITPSPVVRYNGRILSKGVDYSVTYLEKRPSDPAADEDGYAPIPKITGTGNYKIRIQGKGNFDPDTVRDVNLFVYDKSDKKMRSVSSLVIDPIPDQRYEEDSDRTPKKIEPYGAVKVRISGNEDYLTPYSETRTDLAHTDYDYKIEFCNNDSVGTAYAVITGNEDKGISGVRAVPFNIKGISITKASISGLSRLSDVVYTGDPITLSALMDSTVSVSVNGKTLRYYDEETHKGDYTAYYESNINAGTAAVYFVGRNGYTDTLKKSFKIRQRDITEDYTDSKIRVRVESCNGTDTPYASAEYMKGGARPAVSVEETDKDGNVVRILKESVDYTLAYSNNRKINPYEPVGKVKVKGKGNYKGTKTAYYYVVSGNISASVEMYAPDLVAVPGKEKAGNYKAKVVVKGPDGKKLSSGSDYRLRYYLETTDDSDASYRDYLPFDITDVTVSKVLLRELSPSDRVRAGDRVFITAEPAVKKKGIPYYTFPGEGGEEVYRYGRNIFSVDVIEASNDISKGVFKIAQKDYTGLPVALAESDFTDRRFNSKSSVQLRLGSYNALDGTYDPDCDFVIIGYTGNVKKGTAKVTLRGVNGLSGTKTVSFKIGAKKFIWW